MKEHIFSSHTIRLKKANGSVTELSSSKEDSLLRTLQKNNIDLYAPCGGNGTCGKCQVHIKGEGIVTSCKYIVSENIEIQLPEERGLKILTAQHEYCFEIDENSNPAKTDIVSYGLAIDIGTTTLAFYLLNIASGEILEIGSGINPQTRYGADVISRIQFCNREQEKINELQLCLIDSINYQIDKFVNLQKINRSQIDQISITGNPTMLHLLLAIDPISIALAPFKPVFTDEQFVKASSLGINCESNAIVRTLPSISAYVGSDIIAGLASIKPDTIFSNYLFLDLGTNGEMALVTPKTIYTCATAAGPALEGGNISCGMGAFPGAISEYSQKDKYLTVGGEQAKGICGSGLIDILAFMVENNIVNSEGTLEEDFIIFSGDDKNNRVSVNQQDIREVQLAKAAIIAGIKILVSSSNLEFDQIDGLFLAGGFGNYINIKSAVKIGLLPTELENKSIAIGNTSASGALLALKSNDFNENLKEVMKKSEYIELSTHDDFVMEYAMNMNF